MKQVIGARTPTREIGRVSTPPLTRDTLSSVSQMSRTDRTDGRTDVNVSTDRLNVSTDRLLLQKLVAELGALLKSSESVHGQKVTKGGLTRYVFTVRGMSSAERFERALAWMRANQITNRAAFFEACPWANRSASLHNRCIKTLTRSGEIERVGREYVWRTSEDDQG